MKKIAIALSVLFVSGCSSTPQPSLYWGAYSDTLYEVRKQETEQSHAAHERQLLSIIKISKEKNWKVPPGVYAELGFYALQKDDAAAAANYFDLEQQEYPEGEVLLQHAQELLN